MEIKAAAKKMKLDAPYLAATSLEERNVALLQIAKRLEEKKQIIFDANADDMACAKAEGIPEAVQKRLKFNENKLEEVLAGIKQLVSLEDPIHRTIFSRELDEGLILRRVACPIGVIGVIFEARPDALVQISSLCIKSGNCAILKGGKETRHTNRVLFRIIYDAAIEAGLPEGCLLQAEAHSEIDELLSCDKEVDLLIPRGSNQFVQYIMNHTKIPVMGHADGVCHIYIDEAADEQKVLPILLDAKMQYTAACNAMETILVQKSVAERYLPMIAKSFQEHGIRLRGNEEVQKLITVEAMTDEEYHQEYLDLIASVKIVSDVREAVEHINRFGSHHTDCILTEQEETAQYFMEMVDSAGVYQNCSTRFADGFRYGFGAEVGISTSKLHARGPVGLDGLVTYKYQLRGQGHLVDDYATKKKEFHFKDLSCS